MSLFAGAIEFRGEMGEKVAALDHGTARFSGSVSANEELPSGTAV